MVSPPVLWEISLWISSMLRLQLGLSNFGNRKKQCVFCWHGCTDAGRLDRIWALIVSLAVFASST